MRFLIFLRRLRLSIRFSVLRRRPKISLLIPFSSDNKIRSRHFKWLLKYWAHELPDAEIIIGKSKSTPFCKGEAFNRAFRKSKGKVCVLLDADAYMSGKVIENCANRILEAVAEGQHLWYVPYRHLYRLNEKVTEAIVHSDPKDPLRIPCPPPVQYITNIGDASRYGHRYGAMVMIVPREAIEIVGCFDERFKGWGGEDIAYLKAFDTLYGKHKTKNASVFHLWHPFYGHNYLTRKWDGQEGLNINSKLASRYMGAHRRPEIMRDLVDEFCKHGKERGHNS